MNRDQLKKNIGKKFKFFPIPVRNSATGQYESDKNEWLLRRESADNKGFEFLNLIGDYNPLVLDSLKIKNFDEPDTLILRGQVVFDGSTVRYEPFTAKPVSAEATNASLVMTLEGADQTGILHISHANLTRIASPQFLVTNSGKLTVRDYRVEIFVPQSIQYYYGMRPGSLTAENSVDIRDQAYTAYRKTILEPIYKEETVRIGDLLFTIDVGDHSLFWRIRCDDGVFPSETECGVLRINARDRP
jgi:hypothetical protein